MAMSQMRKRRPLRTILMYLQLSKVKKGVKDHNLIQQFVDAVK